MNTLSVSANDWAPHDKTLRSYEMVARYVVPHFQGTLKPTNLAYDRACEVGPGLLQAAV